MTADLSPAALEALQTRLRDPFDRPMNGAWNRMVDEAAETIKALTDRNTELEASRDGWAARMMEFATAQRRIAEALAARRDPLPGRYETPMELVHKMRVILSAGAVQGDAKLATNPTHPETEPGDEPEISWAEYADDSNYPPAAEPWTDPLPYRYSDGRRASHSGIAEHAPRTRAEYEAEEGATAISINGRTTIIGPATATTLHTFTSAQLDQVRADAWDEALTAVTQYDEGLIIAQMDRDATIPDYPENPYRKRTDHE